MEKTMRAAVLDGIRTIRFEERPVPVPKAGELLVRMDHVGICGSDLHYYEDGRIGDFVVRGPLVLGHEAAGTVVGLGAAAKGFAVGDRVALEPGVPCGHCRFCREGRYNLCPDVVFLATPPYDGAFCEYLAHPAGFAYRLPDGVGTLDGALAEPLAVGFQAATQGGARPGLTACVLGAGCIGLMTVLALRATGVSEVFATDVVAARLARARELGARETCDASAEDAVAWLMERTSGAGADLVFETAGNSRTTRQTAEMVARGGTIVLVGMTREDEIPYALPRLLAREATLRTVFRYRNQYPACLAAIAGMPAKPSSIVTDIFPFDRIGEALAHASADKRTVVKAAVAFP